jgi:hypothetical protein
MAVEEVLGAGRQWALTSPILRLLLITNVLVVKKELHTIE